MPITHRLMNKARNRHVVTPAWFTLEDWFYILAKNPMALPLIDFGEKHAGMRVGVTALNWYILDLFGKRIQWYLDGWLRRDEFWMLVNPMRYRILGYQPRRPYALDVRDFIATHHPTLLYNTLQQQPFFACAPTIQQRAMNDSDAEASASTAPWGRLAVLNEQNHIIGMITGAAAIIAELPPVFRPIDATPASGGRVN